MGCGRSRCGERRSPAEPWEEESGQRLDCNKASDGHFEVEVVAELRELDLGVGYERRVNMVQVVNWSLASVVMASFG